MNHKKIFKKKTHKIMLFNFQKFKKQVFIFLIKIKKNITN